MKKVITSLTVFVLVLFIMFNVNVNAASDFLDVGMTSNGIVGIEYLKNEGSRFKVVVSKDSEKYYYDYSGLKKEYFPLQCGSGKYEVSIFENLYGATYKLIKSEIIDVNLGFEYNVYLQSVQNVCWNYDMSAISKAAELTNGLELTADKVEAVYNYIIENIDYDYKKINNIDKLYVPDIEEIFNSGKGICYDYSSLLASMLRSQGIPTKLVKGYSDNVNGYHAWNEVLIDEEWVIIDTTYDAVKMQLKALSTIEKNINEYEAVRVY